MRGSSFAWAGSGWRIGAAIRLPSGSISRERPMLNGICPDESIQAPKPEISDHAEQGTQALAHPCACRFVAGGMATPLAPPVRPRAGLRAGESDERAIFLRVSGHQSRLEIELPRGDPGHGAWR